ncbi:MAG: HigA family addiction module antitoxin [Caulobacteraceae bacterium]
MMHSPPHVGEFVREVIAENGLNMSSGARVLGVTRQALSTLANCRGGLSPDMAVRIEKAFGVRMDTLLRMQTNHEIAQARRRADAIHVERFATA